MKISLRISLLVIVISLLLVPWKSQSQSFTFDVIPTSPQSYYCSGVTYYLVIDIPYPDYYVNSSSDWKIYSSSGSVDLEVYGPNYLNAYLTLNTPYSWANIEVTYFGNGNYHKGYGYFEAQHINANLIGYACKGSGYNLSVGLLPTAQIATFEWTFPSGCLFDGNSSPYSTGTPTTYSYGTLAVGNNAVSGDICVYLTSTVCADVGSPICQYMNVSVAAPSQPNEIHHEMEGSPCPDNHWTLSIEEVQGAFLYDWWQNSTAFLLDQSSTYESELIIKHGAYEEGTTVYVDAWNGCGYSPSRSHSFITLSEEQCKGKKGIYHDTNISIFPNPINDQFSINIPKSDYIYTMFIYNSVGMLLINNRVLHFGENKFRLNEYSPGTYFIKIANESGIYLKRIIVIR
jgi:hypothetical protein